MTQGQQNQGFTLIELLVVLGILILLSSLSVPVLRNAMDRGQAVKCQGNLRAMAQAALLYAAEREGQFPPALVTGPEGSQGWDFCIKGSDITPGWIWREYGVNQILQCPGFKGADNWKGEPHTGYNYNSSYIGGMRMATARGTVLLDEPSAYLDDVAKPGATALFGDGEFAGGANKFMRAPLPGLRDQGFSGREAGTQGFRHRDRTQVAFVDGHVESLPKPEQPGSYRSKLAGGTGFLSTDNSLYDLD